MPSPGGTKPGVEDQALGGGGRLVWGETPSPGGIQKGGVPTWGGLARGGGAPSTVTYTI